MQKNSSWYGGWFLIMILLVSGCETRTSQESLTPEKACEVYEKEMNSVSLALAESLTGAGKNALAVVDFTDRGKTVTDQGLMITKDLSLALADAGRGFWVVSGPYLRKMLKSQQLSEDVLKENPQAATTLWQVMGIEALITGTLKSRGEMIRLSLKILDTDTAEVIGKWSGDITKKETISRMVNDALTKYNKIDILFNYVGGEPDLGPHTSFMEQSADFWDRMIDLNLKSTMMVCQAVLGKMIERRYGKIINTGAIAGKVGAPHMVPYSAVKGGIIALTKALALVHLHGPVLIFGSGFSRELVYRKAGFFVPAAQGI